LSSFSRGRSSVGQSRIDIEPPYAMYSPGPVNTHPIATVG